MKILSLRSASLTNCVKSICKVYSAGVLNSVAKFRLVTKLPSAVLLKLVSFCGMFDVNGGGSCGESSV